MPLVISKSTAVDGFGTHCVMWLQMDQAFSNNREVSGVDRRTVLLNPLSARDSLVDRKLAVSHMEMPLQGRITVQDSISLSK